MSRTCCGRCQSTRLAGSRRRSWIEYAVAFCGWRLIRCRQCGARYVHCGAGLIRTSVLRRIERKALLVAAAMAALAAVLAAILLFTHAQASATAEGLWLAL